VKANLNSEVACSISESRAQPGRRYHNQHGRRCSATPGPAVNKLLQTCRENAGRTMIKFPYITAATRLWPNFVQINDFAEAGHVQPRAVMTTTSRPRPARPEFMTRLHQRLSARAVAGGDWTHRLGAQHRAVQYVIQAGPRGKNLGLPWRICEPISIQLFSHVTADENRH